MRKYFLLTAVALMMSGTLQASEGTFNASVSVKEATQLECDNDLNFGTLVVVNEGDMDNYAAGELRVSGGSAYLTVTNGVATHYGEVSGVSCSISDDESINPNNILLDYNPDVWDGMTMSLTHEVSDADAAIYIDGTLSFWDISEGDYTTTVNLFILEE